MSDTVGSTSWFEIRKATSADGAVLSQLIAELAEYHNAKDGPKLNGNDISEHLKREYCFAFVAVLTPAFNSNERTLIGERAPEHVGRWKSGDTVAFALWHYCYSTWEGRCLWLEDMYVRPPFRRFGIATAMWRALAEVCKSEQLARIQWCALQWNQPAVSFYKRLGAVNLFDEWDFAPWKLSRDKIEAFLRSSPSATADAAKGDA